MVTLVTRYQLLDITLPFSEALLHLARLCKCLSHVFIYLHYFGLVFLLLGAMVYIIPCLLPRTTYLVICFIELNKGVYIISSGSWLQNQALILDNLVRKGYHRKS